MAEHYEELPAGKGFPTPEDMERWQIAFDELIPGGNASELIGFMRTDDGHLMGICRLKCESNA